MSDAQPFAAATEAQWRALVERALGGAPFETLILRTFDGMAMEPLYQPAAEGPRPLRGEAGPWRAFARIDDPNLDRACAQARGDLAQGAAGLDLVFAGSPCAFGFGLGDGSRQAAARFFAEVEPAADARLALDCPCVDADAAARALDDWTAGASAAHWPAPSFGFDPAASEVAPIAAAALRLEDGIAHCFCADGRRAHAAGASEAQELAFVLAAGVRALRALEAAGAALDRARGLIAFGVAVDVDFFLSIAKLRALRLLWARVEEACGLAPRPIYARAETAWRMMTQRDPWTNILRAGVAVAAAALGGADAVAVLPFTQALGLPDAGARRLARNTQLVLMHEAHLAKVADPAAGAGAFEALTLDLCARAWALFQEIEGLGGIAAALANGFVQEKIAAARAARARDGATLLATIVGTSVYPDLAEIPVATLGAAPSWSEACEAYAGLQPSRLSEPFERLRDRSDQRLAATGARPRLFIAPIGAPAGAGEAAAFAKALFETGGIEAVFGEALESAQDLAAAFTASKTVIACLCPAPEVESAKVASCARALAGAQARGVFLTRTPGADEAALREAGVSSFLYPGCDALAALEAAQAPA